MLAEEYVRFHHALTLCHSSTDSLLGYSLQHQVSSQQTVRPVCYYLDPAASQAVQQGPPEWSGRLLW